MPPDPDLEVIDDFEEVRLLINTYLIKKTKCMNKSVNQENFINEVNKEYRTRGYCYPRKRIVYTWKQLLESYQHCKKNFTDDKAKEVWPYFTLMNNCFDKSGRSSSEKFKDSKWTLHLMESLKKHKPGVLRWGPTMYILQAVEDDFRKIGNYDINQKDIYNQWLIIKRFYKRTRKTTYYKEMSNNDPYFKALNELFDLDAEGQDPPAYSKSINTSENELSAAIESIKDENREVKRQKTDNLTENLHKSTTPFTIVMHDLLLLCFKRNKDKMNSGEQVDSILKEAYEEFKKLGYNVTQESVANEWNDLTSRYELIKNTKNPDQWPYYSDMSDIYGHVNSSDQSKEVEDQDNLSTIGSIIVENLRKDQNLKSHGYAKLTEKLLNVYESNSKEFLEIKDILVERNLLREETNYLLDVFVQKSANKK